MTKVLRKFIVPDENQVKKRLEKMSLNEDLNKLNFKPDVAKVTRQ
jgi:hypothetical protein